MTLRRASKVKAAWLGGFQTQRRRVWKKNGVAASSRYCQGETDRMHCLFQVYEDNESHEDVGLTMAPICKKGDHSFTQCDNADTSQLLWYAVHTGCDHLRHYDTFSVYTITVLHEGNSALGRT